MAQQDAQFSQFMFNTLYYNPGAAGTEGISRATLISRVQWLGYTGTTDPGGAPTTQTLSADHPLKLFKSTTPNSGVGINLTNDWIGPYRQFNFKLAYSYHIKLQNGGVLGAGLRAGMFSQRVASVLRASDGGDVVVDGLNQAGSQIKPDFGVGVHYSTTKYWGSIALSHINRAEFDFGIDKTLISSKLANHLFISGGYNLQVNPELVVSPSLIFQSDFVKASFNYGAIVSLSEYKYWGGLTVRQSIAAPESNMDNGRFSNDDIIFIVGMSFLKNNSLRVGYAFDLVTSGVNAKELTSHELMASYVLPLDGSDKYTRVRTPRYRKEN